MHIPSDFTVFIDVSEFNYELDNALAGSYAHPTQTNFRYYDMSGIKELREYVKLEVSKFQKEHGFYHLYHQENTSNAINARLCGECLDYLEKPQPQDESDHKKLVGYYELRLGKYDVTRRIQVWAKVK